MQPNLSAQPEVFNARHDVDGLPIPERYGIGVPLAAAFIGISRSRVYELLRDGAIEGVVVGGRRIVLVQSLLRMLGQAPTAKRETAA